MLPVTRVLKSSSFSGENFSADTYVQQLCKKSVMVTEFPQRKETLKTFKRFFGHLSPHA